MEIIFRRHNKCTKPARNDIERQSEQNPIESTGRHCDMFEGHRQSLQLLLAEHNQLF
jgi:hypothetical protein